MDIVSFMFGLVLGICLAVLVVRYQIVNRPRKQLNPNAAKNIVTALALLMIVGFMLLQPLVSYAQTATPIPLIIPTNQIFSETNNWMAVFAPVAAIGIGISIALAVLGYLGKMIKSAFN